MHDQTLDTHPGDRFRTVTETPDVQLSRQGLAMNYHRYRFAREHCAGKRVLEVACGAGQGLGYLGGVAQLVVGGDISPALLRIAREHYGERHALFALDAHRLPFRDRSFDVVVLFEAIYYLARPERFVSECQRVLRPGGEVIVATVNREWNDFNPSPHSQRYFSARELAELLGGEGFEVEVFGAFPASGRSVLGALVSLARRAAVRLHLIPRTMRGKQLLKRLFYGKLSALPREIRDGLAPYADPERLHAGGGVPDFKVLYAMGKKSS